MQPENHWGMAAGALIVGLILGSAGGYYYAATYAQQPAQSAAQTTETTQTADTAAADVQTNPYADVKVNPFE